MLKMGIVLLLLVGGAVACSGAVSEDVGDQNQDVTAGNPCAGVHGGNNGVYCASSTQGGFNRSVAHAGWLYTCSNGSTTHVTECANGCNVAPAGSPDSCKTAAQSTSLPGGSYQETCRNCSYDAKLDILTCDCRGTDGVYAETSMGFAKGASGYINNCDGLLFSGGCEKLLPGSYTRSCHQCEYIPDGDVWGCYCQDRSGHTQQATMDGEAARSCGDLSNCNGQLHCGSC